MLLFQTYVAKYATCTCVLFSMHHLLHDKMFNYNTQITFDSMFLCKSNDSLQLKPYMDKPNRFLLNLDNINEIKTLIFDIVLILHPVLYFKR